MKKLALSIVFLLTLVGVSKAEWNDYGVLGGFAGQKVWRSSVTNTLDQFTPLATGYVCIGYVQVLSTGISSTIQFTQMRTTTSFDATDVREFQTHWSTLTNTVNTDLYWAGDGKGYYCMLVTTTGFAYTQKYGTKAKVNILWDYIYPPR